MITDHVSPNYTFDINFTVKITSSEEWARSSEIPCTQATEKTIMESVLEYTAEVEICNVAIRSISIHSFSKWKCTQSYKVQGGLEVSTKSEDKYFHRPPLRVLTNQRVTSSLFWELPEEVAVLAYRNR